jgi:hypothetical protein
MLISSPNLTKTLPLVSYLANFTLGSYFSLGAKLTAFEEF